MPWLVSLSLFCAVIAGCQSGPDPSIELLESELRFYEDQLFMQKRDIDRLTAQIDSCRRYNAALKRELKGGSNGSSTPSVGGSSNSTIPNDEFDESDLQLPDIVVGDEELVEPEPAGFDDGADEAIEPEPADINEGDDTSSDLDQLDFDDLESDSAFRSEVGQPRIAKIVLNKRLTGAYSDVRHLGADGLSVVIEPQDDQGEYVSLPGEVTIEAYSQKNGSNQRICRWDFDEVEVSAHLRESLFGKGIHLRLPWPVEPPNSKKVRLVVNYTRPNGDVLLAKKDITIQTPPFKDFEVARVAAETEAAAEQTAERPEWTPKRR